jgi:hypothetical protein
MDLNLINTNNHESLEEYKNLLTGLSDIELSTPMPAGWTVSAVLCHLAFWDQRVITLLNRWDKTGVEFSPVDIDMTNDSTLPFFLAVPVKKAISIFLETGSIVDLKIADLNQRQISEIEEKAKNVSISRAKHRLMHLNDLKTALGKS